MSEIRIHKNDFFFFNVDCKVHDFIVFLFFDYIIQYYAENIEEKKLGKFGKRSFFIVFFIIVFIKFCTPRKTSNILFFQNNFHLFNVTFYEKN